MVSLLSSKTASKSMDKADRRNRLRHAILEMLERRELMAADIVKAIYAPNTTEEYRSIWDLKLNEIAGAHLNGNVSGTPGQQFNLPGDRWSNPTGGPSPNTGDPSVVTWSIVPDGTIDSQTTQQSNLIQFMDSIYGSAAGPVSNRPWFGLIKKAYDNWSEVSGLTFVYEAADDGAPFAGNANRGVTGVRGDVRIGGHNIDGNFNVLAYNYLPSNGGNAGFDGDMVIDTNDRWYRDVSQAPNQENRGLVNVVTHESGHGIGILHVEPIDETKLMEPFISLAYLGAQHDDILAAQQLYGDDKEKNNTRATATNLGDLSNGTVVLQDVSINANFADNDWYKFTIPAAGRLTLNITPTGQAYNVGPQGGTVSATDSRLYADLNLELVSSDGTTLAQVNANPAGLNETITNLQLPSGGTYFVKIAGLGTRPQQYRMSLTLAGIVLSTADVTGPRLLSVAPNSGEIFSFNQTNTLPTAPTELVLRFDGSSDLDASTLAKGIRITRAGKDGLFDGVGDSVIVPGFVGFGDNSRIVIVRFAETLPDDLYRVEVMGEDIPAQGLVAIKSTNGDKLTPRLAGTDRDIFNFRLQLGAQVLAIVPQPVDRKVDGSLDPKLDTIRVYFNNDDLDAATATNPNFYQLIYTSDSASPADDVRFVPTTVTYDPVADMATLTFSSRIDQLAGPGSYRLRVGSNTAVNSVSNPPAVPLVAPAADPSGYFGTAISLDAQLSTGSVKVNENLNNVGNPLPLDFIGSDLDPGNRDIRPKETGSADNHVGNGSDGSSGIATATYSFTMNTSYGNDSNGRPVFTSITPDQKQRVREVFEFYSKQLGVNFTETENPNATYRVVVGDMWPNGVTSRPGGEAGVAGGSLAIMDGAETWDNDFGGSFFGVTLHEVGHLLGLGHTYDLPPGTTMGSYDASTSEGTAGATRQYPGNNDVIHGQFIYRPDNKDVDLYRFSLGVGQTKTVRIETIAERLANSSNADTVVTLYKQTLSGLTVVARNDDYFSSDSFLTLDLEGGASGATYFIGVTVSGNQDYSPAVSGSGSGGTSAGRYQLVVDLVDKTNVSIVDKDGTALDGDGDGIAGGDFNFWFRTAAPMGVAVGNQPRMIFVDKGYTGASTGSPTQPFSSLPTAAAVALSGDILRVVGSLGVDGQLSTAADNPAYELGRGGPGNAVLSDGLSFQVPQGVTMMVDAGAIFKLRGSRIVAGSVGSGTDASFGAIQVLGTPTQPVYFTSYDDQSLGTDTNPIITTPQAGDWAGIEMHNDVDRSQGRGDWERRGIFLNYVANADIRYGGGQVTVATPSPAINPLYLAEARPTLLYNKISRSADAAISADPDSFEETRFTEPRYQQPRFVGDNGFRPDYDRIGPDIRGNQLQNNSINGIFVRVPTAPGQELTSLNVAARFDDTDIVHVFGENLLIGGTPGGAITETIAPNVSLLQATAGTGGGLVAGVHNYKVTFVDRYGNESLPSAAVAFTVPGGSNSLTINNLPVATGDYVGRRVWRLAPASTTYQLVGELDKSNTTFVDKGVLLGVNGGTLATTALQRARTDARLAVDPGIIIKSLGSRIEAGISSQIIAEGTASRPIIFTSKLDDRYGAGSTFDTNNDGAATRQGAGDWGGLVARHLSSMSIDHALIAFGGGTTSVPGGFAGFSAIEFQQAEGRVANSVIEFNASGVGGNLAGSRAGRGANASAAIFVDASQPIIIDNIIRDNLATAINLDADSLKAKSKQDTGRQTGEIDLRPGALANEGPLVRGNRLAGNSINGMEVRGGTLTTESVWDDTDIVHVLRSDIDVPNYHHVGGLRLVSHVDESLVVKLEGSTAGFTAGGRLLDINDRIGGTLQIQGAPGFPVVLTSLRDDSVGAGFDPTGLPQFDTNGNSSGDTAAAGNWRSIRISPLSNDRNLSSSPELESDQIQDRGTNDDPVTAQALGGLANSLGAGDENLRLGFTVNGSVASPADVDVYSFVGTAGTQIWIDLDKTGASLDSVVELISENGTILAQSDNSLAESAAAAAGNASTLYQNPNTALIAGNSTQVMEQDPFAVANSWTVGTARDLQSINPLDAGMRVILPGTQGTSNTYYLRIRSSNLGVGDAQSKLQDVALIRDGKTTGAYRVQVRLQQTDEVAGSSINYADVRFATNGLEALATPVHSPLLGDNATTFTGVIQPSAMLLGDLGRSDKGALTVAGQLNSRTDVSWYEFTVQRNDVQLIAPAGGTLTTAGTHVATIFDIDYADGYGGANTNLWVYSKTDGRLVYMGTDSNILDDRAAPNQGSDVDDLTRGSSGSRDPFIGAQALPVGSYYVAVTNNSQLSVAMAQFQQRSGTVNGVNSVLTRVEPVESVQRISEDRFDPAAYPSTAFAPVQVSFAGTQAGITSSNQVPFTLGDLVSYVVRDNGTNSWLSNVNAMTAAYEEDISSSPQVRDIAMQPTGILAAYRVPINTGLNTVFDANSAQYLQLDTVGNGATQVLGGSGLSTFTVQRTDDGTANPPVYTRQARSHTNSQTNNNPIGDGYLFQGLTFWSDNASSNASLVGIAVGSRGNGQTSFRQGITAGNTFTISAQVNYNATNVVYAIDPANGTARNANGTVTRAGDGLTSGAGTAVVEMGRFLSGTAGGRYTEGTVTGLAKIGSTLYAVSDLGELFAANVGTGNDPFPGNVLVDTAAATYYGQLPFRTLLDSANNPIRFSGLSAGPTNLTDANGNSLANVLFGITDTGAIYAFDTGGNPVNLFPGGVNFTSSASGFNGAVGLAFSPLDVNLWHVTETRSGEAGHGYPVTFNRSRPSGEVSDRNSLYFGFENAGNSNARQNGIWSSLHSIYNNTVNLPGGAKGAVESNTIDLSGYAADDLPMLYFNYYLQTENSNASDPTDANFQRDSFRVYATVNGTTWTLLATNNADNGSRTAPNDFLGSGPAVEEYDQGFGSSYTDAFGNRLVVQELYDVNDPGVGGQDQGGTAPNAWRQARLDLSPFAGQQDLRLRFEFATGGTFNTGDALRGGVEITAAPAWEITDGQSITLNSTDMTPVVNRRFEFDLGLMLNMPGGASIVPGSTISTPFGTFTLNTTAGAGIITYAVTDTPAQVAAKVLAALTALPGVTGYIHATRPNVVVLPTSATVAPGTYTTTGLSAADVIIGRPGITAGSQSVPIRADLADYDQSAQSVRDALRTAMATALANGETRAFSVYGNTIRMFKYVVTNNSSPLGATTSSRFGDTFGVNNTASGTGNLGVGVAERARNNTGAGVFIDDIIIGLAERGEQVINAPLGNQTFGGAGFFDNRDYEPRGYNYDENEEGRYQLEIRTAYDYGISFPHDSPLNPPPADYLLQESQSSNFPQGSALGFQVPAASAIADGTKFTLNDGGSVLVTFEFNVLYGANDTQAAPTTPGNIVIAIRTNWNANQVATAIRNAINGQSLVKITASITGEMIRNGTDVAANNSSTVYLNGPASITRTGLGLPAGSPLTLIKTGADFAGFEDTGDRNRGRAEQGQFIVSQSSFSNSSQWGVRLDDTNSPTSPRNLPTPNPSRLAVGTVLVNNIFNSNTSGGVAIIGDVSNGSRPVVDAPVVRVINNSFFGTRSNDAGVQATNGSTPTILNNIFSNYATAISVDAASSSSVVGANIFKGNANNGVLGAFPIALSAADPLFVNPTNGNFYLAAGSQAIDSSLEALAERLSLSQIRNSIGLPPSPMLAPDRDIFGQRRVDDPSVSTPAGLGSNVFKDRGATDRSDFAALQAVLLQPQDNDSANVDVDRTISYVRLSDGLVDYFSILLSDGEGIGPDSRTVTPDSIRLTENGRLLTAGVDYIFGYNVNSRTVRLTPLAGIWRSDSVYEITMNNRDGIAVRTASGNTIADGDTLTVTMPDSTTRVLTFRKGGVPGPLDVAITNLDSAYQVSLKLSEKINTLGGGVSSYVQGSGVVMIVGANAVASSRPVAARVATISAIRDLAGNALAANRANTLTQFTIIMPDVHVDYGDSTATPTLQAVNGARHALLPVDAPLLALGQFADGDADGAPSAAANADDNDSSVDLQTLGSLGLVTFGPAGPATVVVPASASIPEASSFTIIDPLLKTATFEFTRDAVVTPGSIPVTIAVGDTANQVAAKLVTAVNGALLAGRVAGVAAVATGSTVSLGGTAQHKFIIPPTSPLVRLPVGNVELVMPGAVNASFDGLTFRISDGSGNVVTFEISNTAGPQSILASSVPVNIDLTAATPVALATAIANAINGQRALGNVSLGVASVVGNSVTIRGNDEDGVTFGSLFNSKAVPVPVTVVSTGSGLVDAWIDWNNDGDYIDAGEQVLTNKLVQAGANVFNVATPASAAIGFTTARFRLSVMGGLLPNQLAVGGEVEDHLIEIVTGTPPVATDDSYTIAEDNVLTVGVPGVLANDTDADNSVPLTVFDPDPTTSNVDPLVAPINGTLQLNTNGSFTYTPNLDFFGTDTFVYYVTDPRLISNAPATVTITVTPVNDAPAAVDDTVTILEDAVTTIQGSALWANDLRHFRNNPNEDGQILTLVNAELVAPLSGSVSVVNDVLTYTPPLHYNNHINGPAIIKLTIRDSGVAGGDDNPLESTSMLTVNITEVNDRPEFDMQPSYNTIEDGGVIVVPNFVTGIRPGPVEATDEGTGPALQTENQTVDFLLTHAIKPSQFKVLPTIDPTGQLTFQLADDINRILAAGPTPGFEPILIEVIAQDSGSGTAPNLRQSLPQTLTILPTEVNDVPEFTIAKPAVSREDVGLVTIPGFIDPIRKGPTTALDETNQTLTPSLTYVAAAFSQAPAVDPITGTLTYQTAPHVNSFTHSLVVTLTLTDNGLENGLPAPKSTTKTFTIDVTPVNDAPIFTMPQPVVSVNEDQGDVSLANFLTQIRPGPTSPGLGAIDETNRENQTVSFILNPVGTSGTQYATPPAIDANGRLTFKLNADVNRLAPFQPLLVELIAEDTGIENSTETPPDVRRTTPVTFTIQPSEINDAPVFNIQATTSTTEDAGVVKVANFMTGQAAGPSSALDELASQNITVTTSFDTTAFINVSIDKDTGELTYQARPDINNQTGNSLVVGVTVTDDGTENGVPTPRSTTKSFTISITPVNDVPIFALPSPTVVVLEDNEDVIGQPTTRVPGFANPVAAGPVTAVDETTLPATKQTPVFEIVSNSAPNLFEATGQPRILNNGTLEFVTKNNQNGSAVIVVQLADTNVDGSERQVSATQTFTITLTPVNDAPEFTIPPTFPVQEDAGARTVPGFATQLRPGPIDATDETEDFVVNVEPVDPSAFEVRPTIGADGTLRFKVAENVNSNTPGKDLRVRVSLTDKGIPPETSAEQTFTLLVSPINDIPSFNLPEANKTITVREDEEAFVGTTMTRLQLIPPASIKVGPDTATDEPLTQSPKFDIVSYSSQGLFSIAPQISPTGELTFHTAPNQNGKSVVIFRLNDQGPASPVPNVSLSEPQTVTINITAINDAPEFQIPPGLTVVEDQGLVSRTAFATQVRRGPVGTDDENGQQIIFDVTPQDPNAFEVKPSIEVDGTLTFKTAANVNSLNGNLVVFVQLRDLGADSPAPNNNLSVIKTFTITATPENDPPIPDSFTATTAEDTQIELQVAAILDKDAPGPTADENGQTLTLTQVERTTANGGTVTPVFTGSLITSIIYRPAPNSVGTDTFLYVVSDNGTPSRSGTGTITITIDGINDAPSFSKGADQSVLEDAGTVTIDAWATGILAGAPASVDEQATQTVSFVVDAVNKTLFEVQPSVDSTGKLSFKPAKDAVGSTAVTVLAVDNGRSDFPNVNRSAVQTFTITLNPANDAPVFTAGGAVTVDEDSNAYSQPWASNIAAAAGLLLVPPTATDESTQQVFFVVDADQKSLFSVQPQISAAGVLTFTPAPNAFGVAKVTVMAQDRGPAGANDQNQSAVQTLTITINAVNDVPSAVPDTFTGDENSLLSVTAANGLLKNDVDPDGNAGLAVVSGTFTSRLGAQVTISADGSLSYDPRAVTALQKLVTGQSLVDDFVYQVRDPEGALSTQATVSIVVTGVDDAPVAVADSFTVPVGQSVLLNVLGNDTDIDSFIDQRTIVITSLPAFGTVAVEAGEVRYTSGVGFIGVDNFAYTVRDAGGHLSNEAAVSVIVNNVPRASNDIAVTTRATPVLIDVLANDSDLDGALNVSSVEIVSQPSNGTAVVQANGKVLYTPPAGFFGQTQFSYFVKDLVGSPSNVATVTVTVGSAWRNPTLDLDVNADGHISPIDALLIINYLNAGKPTNLPGSGTSAPPFIDPNGDEKVTAIDALLVVNYLNTNIGAGEGESSLATEGLATADLAAPIIVTMVTPEQMIATVAPQIMRQIEEELSNELAACQAWTSSDDAASGLLAQIGFQDDEDDSSLLADLATARDENDTDGVDDFFGSL